MSLLICFMAALVGAETHRTSDRTLLTRELRRGGGGRSGFGGGRSRRRRTSYMGTIYYYNHGYGKDEVCSDYKEHDYCKMK